MKISECNRQFDKDYKPYLSDEVIKKSYTAEQIIEIFENNKELFTSIDNEVKDDYLKIPQNHGARHMEDVVLFSYILGLENLKDIHDRELLLRAAQYHDIGRVSGGEEVHAEASAKIAFETLSDKYDKDDLALIATLIEFHEVPRKLINIDEIFISIANKYGVINIEKARSMAEMLKDADALDRTRFVNRARLDSRYLKYDTSLRLIKFSSELQEYYSLVDLQEYNQEFVEQQLLRFTPMELIRMIRHNQIMIHKNSR